MNVYEISVRFMRRAQVKEYEPAEAEVTMKASLTEGEDHMEIASSLMADAKATVIESGLKSGKATASTETASTDAAPANKGGRPRKQQLTPPAETKPASTAAAAAAADPTEAVPAETKPASTAAAPASAPAAEPDEFGEFASGAPAADEKPMSAKELQDWITSHLSAKRIEVTAVKEILSSFGAARTLDTKEGDRAAIKAQIEAKLKK